MDLRQEYTRMRANILKREKRIREKGYGSYIPKVNLRKASELTDKELKTALNKARRYDRSVTQAKVEERREKRKERYEVEKAFKLDIQIGSFIKGVRKWLRRLGKPVNLINLKNWKDWKEYINYRMSISNEKSKYRFDKYVEEMTDVLTSEDEETDVDEVLEDFSEYMDLQKDFIEKSKQAFSIQKVVYSSDEIATRYFEKRKK